MGQPGFIAKFEGGPAEGQIIDVGVGDPDLRRWFCQLGDLTEGPRRWFWAKWQPPHPDPELHVTTYYLDRVHDGRDRRTAIYRVV